MDRIGDNQDEMWDEEDGFFYDLLRFPDGSATRLKVRSMVGLLSLCATTVVSQETIDRFPTLIEQARRFVRYHPEVIANIAPLTAGPQGRHLMAILNEDKLRRVLARMLDEEEFLGPYGIRSLSRYHLEHPFVFNIHGEEYRVSYLPGESNTGMFGGNSNWRGPVWMPVNILILRALLQFYLYYGDEFKVECPTGSGNQMTLFEVTMEIGHRLGRTFLRDESGKRPVYGGASKFQNDPNWRDAILFYEYFHGDNGAGIGANHQTGWTGLVARVIQIMGYLDAQELLHSDETLPAATVYREE
jgi:Mannosylglycerate hydrolase MGH1-like glycoside hydrolase domain